MKEPNGTTRILLTHQIRLTALVATSAAKIFCNYRLDYKEPSRHIPIIPFNSHTLIITVFIVLFAHIVPVLLKRKSSPAAISNS